MKEVAAVIPELQVLLFGAPNFRELVSKDLGPKKTPVQAGSVSSTPKPVVRDFEERGMGICR